MPYIKSPLNYTGGKYKMLDRIIPNFPPEIGRFADLFAGGLNVGVNVGAQVIYANDRLSYLIDLYRYFQETPAADIVAAVNGRIEKYGLSLTNAEGYARLRADYNRDKKSADLFVLACYSFNHQIRFNGSHDFNTPFGKARSSYNPSIERNLIRFCSALQSKRVIFSSVDFTEFDFSGFGKGDLVYCDPPYLITTGSYNDGKRGFKDWTRREEEQLLGLLDELDGAGVSFALSNVLEHKGMTNDLLSAWSGKYCVTFIDRSYANCSYHFRDRETKTVEALITNYPVEEPCQTKIEI